jgi:hypothetical protein
MNSSDAQRESEVGFCTDPCIRTAPDNWAARLVQARQSLHQLLHASLSGQRFESLLTQVGERLPAAREKAQSRVVGWIRSRKSSGASLKLRRVGWQHLCDAIDPDKDALVLTWGTTEGDGEAQWIVSICAKRELPPAAFRRSVILRLRELLVLIPQKEHLLDLNGRVLIVANGELSIE